jgi:superfamily II DNA or RNA helicase
LQDSTSQTIRYAPLRRAKSDEEYALYQAALEWSLDDPIVIDGPDDLKSEQKWRELVKPYDHQTTNLITFCRRLPVTLLADDVGLGKTISAGLIASELMARRRLSNVLVVCPKILGPQWKEELESKFDISAEVVTGRDLIKAKPEGERGAIITTYNSARLYLSQIPEGRFQMLILDEAHKLRNLYGVQDAPMVAKVFQKVLADRFFKYVLMLTATPIQNRLWDLYSLVDLLTVARGHENPFGTPGMFARNFIADKQTDARQLRTEMRDQFRSIIYSYMSRIRRGDANLSFPERNVLLHRVQPTEDEIKLIDIIKGPIQKLGILAQISILQALTSSPHALSAQLQNMARNGTIPQPLAIEVRDLVQSMKASAKLTGLAILVKQLHADRPKDWRLVVFTGRRETQTTIEDYLLSQGIKVGIINGTSGGRNQDTISKFKASPPELHVIVSTEAGSEGVNLQAANILINFDLPWNPMIVEQRIGRIQRLGSEHANVAIYNIILKGTFEEYIVGRLMAKLQMASHAIGDIEALLEAANIGDEDEDIGGFEEQIRKLVLDSLAGKDVELATRLADESITKAKNTLLQEEKNINSLLGAMGDAGVTSPRAPHLPPNERTMDAATFALQGLPALGGQLQKRPDGMYLCGIERRHEVILIGDVPPPDNVQYTDYRPGSPAFDRLASRLTASSLQRIVDRDTDANVTSHTLTREWVKSFGGVPKSTDTEGTSIHFDGTALLRVRATVAHDAYERLMPLSCNPYVHKRHAKGSNSEDVKSTIENPVNVGINSNELLSAAKRDPSIEEFCRFYSERMIDEVNAAGDDDRKKKRLEDEFTPRLEPTLVGLRGSVHREVTVRVEYTLGSTTTYDSEVQVLSSTGEFVSTPEFGKCEKTDATVPVDCLAKCSVTGTTAIRELLLKSDFSGRVALPNQTTICALSGKCVLLDEVETSDVTGQGILKNLLKISNVSGKKAEPLYFGRCEFPQLMLC